MMINTPERLLTVSETAKLWSVCERTVLRKIHSGELEVVMLAARAPRIRESVVARYVESRTRGGSPHVKTTDSAMKEPVFP